MRPAAPSLSDDLRATSLRVLAYMGGLALIAIAGLGLFRTPEVAAAIDPSPQPPWARVARPYPAFQLSMPEWAAAFDYAIMRRTADGARKDVLSWGAVADAGPYALVEIFRPAGAGERFIDAPSEIAARIVSFAVSDDVKPAGRMDSKFGAVPLVDFAIGTAGHERRCLGFARPFQEPAMQIAGWYCSPGREVVSRATLGCVLDRLTILSAGGDAELDRLFARAEVKRTFCGRRNPILAATPEREQPLFSSTSKRSVKLLKRLQLR